MSTTLRDDRDRLRAALRGLVDAIDPPRPKGKDPRVTLEPYFVVPMKKARDALARTEAVCV